MKTFALWDALRTRLSAGATHQHRVQVQHLGMPDHDIEAVQATLNLVGEQLGVTLVLQGHAGDLVLLDVPFARHLTPQLMYALTEDRPVVLLPSLDDDGHGSAPLAERAAQRQRALLRQFSGIELVRRRSRHPRSPLWGDGAAATLAENQSGYDSGFDSSFDTQQLVAEEIERGQQQVVQAVLQGMQALHTPALAASYGPGANLLFDFNARLVHFDPQALQQLRVRRELPQPAPGARPGADALVRELDQTLWDLGLASGPYALLDEPADWWHTPLAALPTARFDRYTRLPRHLDMARRLQAAPATPSALRRHARVSVAELRRFLQAGLMLRRLQWQPEASSGSLQ